MLDGFKDRGAVISCTFGYYNGQEFNFFDSNTAVSIADKPKGANGYGFDRFIIQHGYSITRAEMTQEENERTYAENIKPFKQLRNFLLKLS